MGEQFKIAETFEFEIGEFLKPKGGFE